MEPETLQIDSSSLQEYLDELPEPTTFKEKLLCLWSNLIDTALILTHKVGRKKHGTD